MKNLPKLLSLFGLVLIFLVGSGCVQDKYHSVSGNRKIPRAPYVGSAEWLTWVDQHVDTRYANSVRPDPGSPEWYAIVDHVVFMDHSRDYYYNVYRREYRDDYRRNYTPRPGNAGRYNYADNYYGPARFSSGDGAYAYSSNSKLGSLEWRRAVTAQILSGRVPPPPPRSDPWDTPLAPTSNR